MAIITIGGAIGAGKTVLADKLAKALNYEPLYMGGLFREIAAERGMTIEDFYAALGQDPALERSVDERQKQLMREKDNLVVQGRVAWFFAKESPFTVFNVFLGVEAREGAKRSAKKPEYDGKPLQEIAEANTLREKTERVRYKALYDIEDFLDHGHYDYVLDTTRLSEQEVVDAVVKKLKDRIDYDL